MSRILRCLVLAVLATVAYHVVVMIAEREGSRATDVLRLLGHGRGFTFGMAVACLATGELGLLAALVVLLVISAWPVDLLSVAFALTSGGLVGAAARSFLHAKRDAARLEH
jgi:hypothetical protein